MTDDELRQKALAVLVRVFPDLHADTVESLRATMTVKTYPAGTTLCHRGRVEDIFYVLVEGQADVYGYTDGARFPVDHLTSGDCFGEIGLILDDPRAADVVTSTTVTVIEIDRLSFQRYIRDDFNLLRTVVRLLVQRMIQQEERVFLEMAQLRKQNEPPPKFFICYARADIAFVDRLVGDLLKYGVDLWMDVRNIQPGDSWSSKISRGLKSCQAMLLILSPNATESRNVDDEYNYYLDEEKLIIPIMYRPCDVPFRLRKLHHLDFIGAEDDDDLYRRQLGRLVAFINAFLP
jgi:CRP-like cAMP-binding protein